MKRLSLIIFAALLMVACGGSPNSSITPKPKAGQPLDPQGNWLFVLNSSDGTNQLTWAGQLFELNPPVTTGNQMLSIYPGRVCAGLTPGGTASNVDDITLTINPTEGQQVSPFTLVGKIAPDEKHMSGTWTGGQGCVQQFSGSWTAQVLTPVDGTWTGTADNGLIISATLRENTDQTTIDMGHVTGSLTVTGGGCFLGANLSPEYSHNVHFGEYLLLSATDSNGVTVQSEVTDQVVNPDATLAKGMTFNITGGPCNGQRFTVDLTK